MCGIFGVFNLAGQQIENVENLAERMGGAIRHRGPDDFGHVCHGGVLIGNRRLSIIDLANGHQPMTSDDGMISVVQNGEIYNYRELSVGLNLRTESDTEVILRLYERDGCEFVKQLNGMFAIAIVDRRVGSLFIWRDRVGKKPLYWTRHAGNLYFASEIKSLLAAGVPAQANTDAIGGLLTYNWVPVPFTAFSGIFHLRPGHKITCDGMGVREDSWWSLSSYMAPSNTVSECDILDLLRDATAVRLRADVPLGAFLSGGLDSSSIVACMAAKTRCPVNTFTIGFSDPRFDESMYAAEVAKLFGTDHCCEIVSANMISLWPLVTWHNDQPHGDASFMPTFRVSQLASGKVKVVLTGDGGDELFGGYDVHSSFFGRADKSWSQDRFEAEYLAAISLTGIQMQRDLLIDRDMAIGSSSVAAVGEDFRRGRCGDRINQVLALDFNQLLPSNNLVKPDKMAMACSLETRSPFLDYRMVELAWSIPGEYKVRDGVTKWVLKRALKSILPDEIIYRRKQMFTVPIGEWFKGSLRPLVEEALLSGRSLERGLFRRDCLVKIVESHVSGRENHTRLIRALVNLEMWYRIFIDRQGGVGPATLEDLGFPCSAA